MQFSFDLSQKGGKYSISPDGGSIIDKLHDYGKHWAYEEKWDYDYVPAAQDIVMGL